MNLIRSDSNIPGELYIQHGILIWNCIGIGKLTLSEHVSEQFFFFIKHQERTTMFKTRSKYQNFLVHKKRETKVISRIKNKSHVSNGLPMEHENTEFPSPLPSGKRVESRKLNHMDVPRKNTCAI
ncbi:hypothetical protein V6Z11_D07G254400 [Gossypium hirsutum]